MSTPISLRSFRYSTKLCEAERTKCLNDAVLVHGFDAVYDRMDELVVLMQERQGPAYHAMLVDMMNLTNAYTTPVGSPTKRFLIPPGAPKKGPAHKQDSDCDRVAQVQEMVDRMTVQMEELQRMVARL